MPSPPEGPGPSLRFLATQGIEARAAASEAPPPLRSRSAAPQRSACSWQTRRAHQAGTPGAGHAGTPFGTLTHRAFGCPLPYASELRAHALSPRSRCAALLRHFESRRSSLWATSRSYFPSAPASSKWPGSVTHHSRVPPACSGLPPGPERRALAAWMPKRRCGSALVPAQSRRFDRL